MGDNAAARATQKDFLGASVAGANGLVNAIPVIGHAKGGVHYLCGDRNGGDEAMKSSSRTIGVVGGGLLGALAGPAGVVGGAMAGGQLVDGAATAVEYAIHGEYRPNGPGGALVEGIRKGDAGIAFDGAFGMGMDAAAGAMLARGLRAGAAAGDVALVADADAVLAAVNEVHPAILAEQEAAQAAGHAILQQPAAPAPAAAPAFPAAGGGGAPVAPSAASFQTAASNAASQAASCQSAAAQSFHTVASNTSFVPELPSGEYILYRGVRKGVDPTQHGGPRTNGEQLGKGTYWTADRAVADTYAHVNGDVWELDVRYLREYPTRSYAELDGGTVKAMGKLVEGTPVVHAKFGGFSQVRIDAATSLELRPHMRLAPAQPRRNCTVS